MEIVEGEGKLDPNFFNNEGHSSDSLHNGLVAFWGFDEPSGTRYSRINNIALDDPNGTITSAAGIKGNAISCGSTNGRRLETTGFGLSVSNSDIYTVAFWAMDLTAGNTFSGYIFGVNSSTDWNIHFNDNMYDGGPGDISTRIPPSTYGPYSTVQNGSFAHYALVFDNVSKTLKTFKNGISVGTQAYSNEVNVSSSEISVCNLVGANSSAISSFDGYIDSFGIWDRELSLSEIGRLSDGNNSLD